MAVAWVLPLNSAIASSKVYQKVVPGTVGFLNRSGIVGGSGVLIDAEKRLVITAYHVVNAFHAVDPFSNKEKVRVCFPIIKDGKVVTSSFTYAKMYQNNSNEMVITGEVLKIDPIKDLALVKLARVPKGAKAVPLAKEEPGPGDTIHVIGNSTAARGGLFGYNRGHVRNSFLIAKGTKCFFALCHQSPSNRGDSGGPVVDDNGELVAVISIGTTGAADVEQVVDYSVHLKELRAFIAGDHTYKTACQFPVAILGFKGTAMRDFRSDRFFFQIPKGDVVDVQLQGSGSTDLDLVGYARFTRKPLFAFTSTKQDAEKARLRASWSGLCQIAIPSYHGPDELRAFQQRRTKIPPYTKQNKYSLTIQRTNPIPGPIAVTRDIPDGTTDMILLQYKKGKEKARLSLVGDGTADLDLMVRNPQGKTIANSDTNEARETVEFTPKEEGTYTIHVRNLRQAGRRAGTSSYALISD